MIIEALSNKGDAILDPYVGIGVSIFEAMKLNRRFIGLDINPYAVQILKGKINALKIVNDQWLLDIYKELKTIPEFNENIKGYLEKNNIDLEVLYWFEKKTLLELCQLHKFVKSDLNPKNRIIKELLFTSILQKCCSQKDHYTYITDRCFPDTFFYVNAMDLYFRQTELLFVAVENFKNYYQSSNDEELSFHKEDIIKVGDSRNLNFLDNNAIDLIITSPPYLGVNDYVKSMRLNSLFFYNDKTKNALENEIGARRKRSRKYAYEEYLNDMYKSFFELSRVLKTVDGKVKK